MSDTDKQLTIEEKESAIRMGIVPAGGNRGTIISVIQNVLETGFDWRQDGEILTIEHPNGVITVSGLNVQFVWS
jgi:hypothetical protein